MSQPPAPASDVPFVPQKLSFGLARRRIINARPSLAQVTDKASALDWIQIHVGLIVRISRLVSCGFLTFLVE
jgi:hypothetical protein